MKFRLPFFRFLAVPSVVIFLSSCKNPVGFLFGVKNGKPSIDDSYHPGVPSAPSVNRVNPSSGTKSGGTRITITGANFSADCSATLDEISCTSLLVVSPSQITCTTPSHAIGAVTVRVENSSHAGDGLSDGYTYATNAPAVPGYSISLGAGTYSGAGLFMRATAGEPVQGCKSTGAGLRFINGALATFYDP